MNISIFEFRRFHARDGSFRFTAEIANTFVQTQTDSIFLKRDFTDNNNVTGNSKYNREVVGFDHQI